jgi:hypothetical protein
MISSIGKSTAVRPSFTNDTWCQRLQENGQTITWVEPSAANATEVEDEMSAYLR